MLVLPLTVVVLSVAGGTVSQKYTNLPGIRELHDFLSLKNPGTDAIVKVCEKCYSGALNNTPIKPSKGINPRLIPGVNLSYAAKGLVKDLTASRHI